MKVLFFQRVPALFRKSFFEKLDANSSFNISLASGVPDINENMKCFDNISVEYHESKIKYYFKGRVSLDFTFLKLMKKIRPNIVVITPTPRMFTNYFLLLYCKVFEIPVVGWGMGEMPNRKKLNRFLHSTLQKTLVYFLDGIICYSSVAKEYYQGLGVKNIHIAHNSVDTEETNKNMAIIKAYTSSYNELLAKKYAINLKKNRIVYLGRIIPSKHLDKLINECSYINNVQLIVIGGGSGAYYEQVLQMASKIDSVFLGHKDGLELAEIMNLTDLFVLPSLGGLAINHAMSFGLPCIVSTGDGTEVDLIKNGLNGYIFKSGDFTEMKCLIESFFSKENFNLMGDASSEIIRDKINIDSMVQEMSFFLTNTVSNYRNNTENFL